MSDLVAAIAAHRAAHLRRCIIQEYLCSLSGEDRRVESDKVEAALQDAEEALKTAHITLASTTPRSVAELGALAWHLRAIVAVDQVRFDELTEVPEAFDALASACTAFAGAVALQAA